MGSFIIWCALFHARDIQSFSILSADSRNRQRCQWWPFHASATKGRPKHPVPFAVIPARARRCPLEPGWISNKTPERSGCTAWISKLASKKPPQCRGGRPPSGATSSMRCKAMTDMYSAKPPGGYAKERKTELQLARTGCTACHLLEA